jgi:Zn-dependent protease
MSTKLDEHLSPIASEVLRSAQAEAAKLRHREVEPEHLLIALSANRRATSAAMLRELNADIPRLQQRLRKAAGTPTVGPFKSASYSARLQRTLVLASDEARVFGSQSIETQHLLAGVIREGSGDAKDLLADQGVSLYGVHKLIRTLDFRDGDLLPSFDVSRSPLMQNPAVATLRRLPISVSPIFLSIVGITVLAGILAYSQLFIPWVFAFLFVIGGWVISVCLHEFGHAAMAYLGGDVDVVNKGYLTLDPRKYTHPLISIILPVVFLLLGGIPLPGGAVYINYHMIRSPRMRSLTSAAGPGMTFLSGFILWLPLILLGPIDAVNHPEFWGAWAFLTFLEVLGVFINLLPIPGIDGFGIIEPYLSLRILNIARQIRPYGIFILFAILIFPNPIGSLFWGMVSGFSQLIGINMGLVATGSSVIPRLK